LYYVCRPAVLSECKKIACTHGVLGMVYIVEVARMVKWCWIAKTHYILQWLFSIYVWNMLILKDKEENKERKNIYISGNIQWNWNWMHVYGDKKGWKGLYLVSYWYRVLCLFSGSWTETMILESCWMSVLSGFNCLTIIFLIWFCFCFYVFVLIWLPFYVHIIIWKIILFSVIITRQENNYFIKFLKD